MAQFNGIVSGILLLAAGLWMRKWLADSDIKSWIISTIAWSLILYGIQNIIFAFIGNPFGDLINLTKMM